MSGTQTTIWATLSGPIPAGTLTIPAGQSSGVVTNAGILPTSLVMLQLVGPADATLTRAEPTMGTGTFTVVGNANATAPVLINWLLFNAGTSPTGY